MTAWLEFRVESDCEHQSAIYGPECPLCDLRRTLDKVTKLRRGIDEIKVRAYEKGDKELHDMALELLK